MKTAGVSRKIIFALLTMPEGKMYIYFRFCPLWASESLCVSKMLQAVVMTLLQGAISF
jgi:hypothetical protein